jgi:hypothetical protein
MDPDETLEGSLILEEFRGELGLILWAAMRDVTLWAQTPPENRDGLFHEGTVEKRMDAVARAHVDTPVEMLLMSLAAVTATPAKADSETAALVCLELSRWAQDQGAIGTAIAFAQAAAVAEPLHAHGSRRVGSLSFILAMNSASPGQRQRLARAETWMRRAVALARYARAWDAYAWAYIDLAVMQRAAAKDDPLRAKRYYVLAARAARRHGYLPIRAVALHGLLRVGLDLKEYADPEKVDDLEKLGTAALRAYSKDDPAGRREALQDLTRLWINTGKFAQAGAALRRILPTRTDPSERAYTCALLARACAGVGDVEGYRDAWSGGWGMLMRPAGDTDSGFERTMVELASAALTLQDTPRVTQAFGVLRQRGVLSTELVAPATKWGSEGPGPDLRRAGGSR